MKCVHVKQLTKQACQRPFALCSGMRVHEIKFQWIRVMKIGLPEHNFIAVRKLAWLYRVPLSLLNSS